MNDIDFAFLISEAVGTAYKSAQSHCHALPRHALVELRSLARLCSDDLSARARIEQPERNLERRIETLFERGAIDRVALSLLHELRRKGNMGAHPEDFPGSAQQFPTAAASALVTARALLAWMYRNYHDGAAPPDFELAPVDDGIMRALCYRAVMEADAEAEHTLGKMMSDRAIGILQDSKARAIASGGGTIGGKDFDHALGKALFWLRNAADAGHPQAMTDYGKALASKADGAEKMALGEHYILRAALLGNTDAEAYVGHCHLVGSRLLQVDFAQARIYLERAAEHDHPSALSDLGTMLYQGLGVPRDRSQAALLVLRAARLGFPHAQFNAFVLLSNGDGVEQDQGAALTWLRKSSEQGHPEARLALATLMRSGQIGQFGFDEIEATLLGALADRNAVRLELAALYLEPHSDPEYVARAAILLQQCYEMALAEGDAVLAAKCQAASPPAIKALLAALPRMNAKTLQGALYISQFFDEHFLPYPNRAEQSRRLAAVVQDAVGQLQGVQAELDLAPDPGHKQGRNDLCGCGSGRKYKKCCGA